MAYSTAAPRIPSARPRPVPSRLVPPRVAAVISRPGTSLDPAVQSLMRTRTGHDFSRVRVHTDAEAARSAREVGAAAYTIGEHIAFDVGRYAPNTATGRRLLAHELAHVTQQHAGLLRQPAAAAGPAPVDLEAKRLERDAEAAAREADGAPSDEELFPDEPGLDGALPNPDPDDLALIAATSVEEKPVSASALAEEMPSPPAGSPSAGTENSPSAGTEKEKRVVVDLDSQTATAVEDGKPVKTMPISSGKATHPTHKGHFTIYFVDRDHRSTKYGKCVSNRKSRNVSGGADSCRKGEEYRGAPMTHFQRFNGPEGFHKGVLPGHPDSHGCVRLSEENAKWLWDWAGKGTKVDVGPLGGKPVRKPPGRKR